MLKMFGKAQRLKDYSERLEGTIENYKSIVRAQQDVTASYRAYLRAMTTGSEDGAIVVVVSRKAIKQLSMLGYVDTENGYVGPDGVKVFFATPNEARKMNLSGAVRKTQVSYAYNK